MVILPHALAGALAGAAADDVRHALVGGALSHLVLDRVPHEDWRIQRRDGQFLTACDAMLSVIVVHRMVRGAPAQDRGRVIAGALGGVLPDVVQFSERALGVNVTLPAHAANHTARGSTPARTTAGQALTALACGLLARRVSRG